jgi:rifampicin phosphotransferase
MSVNARVLDLRDAVDVSLCGGKAAKLAQLLRADYRVPQGFCLTMEFYRACLQGMSAELEQTARQMASKEENKAGNLLATTRRAVESVTVPPDMADIVRKALDRFATVQSEEMTPLVVRSSAIDEDQADAAHAGIYKTFVGVNCDPDEVLAKVKGCWAALWTEEAWAYKRGAGLAEGEMGMAVVVQPLILAKCAGVAFSVDPISGDERTSIINAAWGHGGAVVDGTVVPNEYTISWRDEGRDARPRLHSRRDGTQQEMTVWRDGRLLAVAVPDSKRDRPVLTESQALTVARIVKDIEHTLGFPADIEWAFDEKDTLWLTQVRPISTLGISKNKTDVTLWTRANLKEILPEQPSPLALSSVSVFVDRMFRSYHKSQGYTLPEDQRYVKVIHGRPYLNLSLMQQMVAARGGDPAMLSRIIGGKEDNARAGTPAAPKVPSRSQLFRVAGELLTTIVWTPLKAKWIFRAIRKKVARFNGVRLESLSDQALRLHMEHFQATMGREDVLRAIQDVTASETRAYVVLERLLAAWMPEHPPSLLTRLVTGIGTLPNARMSYRLMALGAIAREEPEVRSFFSKDGKDLAQNFRHALAGTRFLEGFEQFLHRFGHRAQFESDAMSPRFAEDPTPLLRIIQSYVRARSIEDSQRHKETRQHLRQQAEQEVCQALIQGRSHIMYLICWWGFSMMYASLQRLLALRDENRDVTTLLSTHLRRVALEFGRRAVDRHALAAQEDIFMLTWNELPLILGDSKAPSDWQMIVQARRLERERDAGCEAPDLLRVGPSGEALPEDQSEGKERPERCRGRLSLYGVGVSAGTVTGKIKIMRSEREVPQLDGSEILVVGVMDPALTPLFPLLRGMIAEMGGLLSHASILAREYGLPAVVNVQGATQKLHEGDKVELDGSTGAICVVEQARSGQVAAAS